MKRILLISLALFSVVSSWAQQPRIFRTEFLPYDKREEAVVDERSHTKRYVAFSPEMLSQSEQEILWVQVLPVDASMNDYNTFLHLENVATSYILEINGQEVVREEDFYSPSELLISPYLHQGNNEITLRMRRPALTELMQDISPMSEKLFANSYFFCQRRISIRDFAIELRPDSTRSFAVLDMNIIIANDFNFEEPIAIGYDIYDPKGQLKDFSVHETTVAGRSVDTLHLKPFIYHANNFKSTAGKSSLYSLMLYIKRSGMLWEYIPLKIAFDDFEWRDGQLYSFGQSVEVKQVRYEPTPDRKAALEQVRNHKKQGVNMLLLPYPQPKWFYDMCDQEGMLVIDGVAINAITDDDRSVGGTPANDPALAEEFLLRVKKMYYRSRNHSCVVGYSLAGEQSGNGYNLYKAYQWLKSVEQQKAVFYFGSDGEWNSDKWNW